MSKRIGTTSLLAIAAFAAWNGSASAQEGRPDAADDGSASQEIVVTATKRAESQLDVPVSITAVTSDALAEQGTASIKDFARQVPGLNYFGTVQSGLSIRGLSTGTATAATVAVTIDDVPVGSSVYIAPSPNVDLDPAMLKQIEVLRGPQGTLYGANSLGGLLKYVTRDPRTNELSGRIQLTGENTRGGGVGGSARGLVNVPIAEGKAGLLLNGFYRVDAPFVDNVLAGYEDEDANKNRVWGGRAALQLTPNDTLTIDIAGLTQRARSENSGAMFLDQNYAPLSGDLEFAALPTEGRTRYNLGTLIVRQDLGAVTLTSLTGYSTAFQSTQNDLTPSLGALIPLLNAIGGLGASPGDRVRQVAENRTKRLTEELRLSSNGEQALQWQLGLFYARERTSTFQTIDALNATGPKNIFNGGVSPKIEDYAAFADATYKFGEMFELGGGIRVFRNEQSTPSRVAGPLNLLSPGGASGTLLAGRGDTSVTWQISPKINITPDIMIYGRVATGYRPGGPNVGTGIPAQYENDTTTNYEIGSKGKLADGNVTYAVNGFYIDWKDIQLTALTAANLSYLINGGRARSYGVEAAFDVTPWQGMKIGLSGAYTNAKLKTDLPANTGTFGPAGSRLPFTPKFSVNLSLEQSFEVAPGWDAYIGGNVNHVGQRFGIVAAGPAIPRISLPDFTQIDVRAGLRNADWQLDFYIRNIGDERGYTHGSLRAARIPAQGFSVFPIQPRTAGVVLTRNF